MTRRKVLAERALYLRRNMTPHEKKLWYRFLAEYEVTFKAQKVIGNYIVDFYCRKARLSVELDGGQHYEKRSLAYDATRTSFLEMREIKQLRFSNRDIDESFEGVCEVIDKEVKARRNDLMGNGFSLLKSKV